MSDRPPLLHTCTVTKRTDFGHGYFELFLDAPVLAGRMLAGQFVNVRVRDDLYPLLRRPFSSFDILKDVRGRPTGISLLGHTVGVGTRMLSRLEPGAKLHLNGPLGHAFEPPENPDTRVIMVGGGIGLAPFLHLTRQWGAAAGSGHARELVLLAGGRSQRDLTFMNRFTGAGANTLLATEDGSAGVKGRVTVLLESELKSLKGKPAVVLTCGPWAMMAAVANLCAQANVPSYASLESIMACGFGVCNGCVARVKQGDGFRYAKTCVEGTVMDCATLIW
jgi:dihydroorotate dehydrogenase electron transfer subunit